jgi:hypothetical protein
VSEWTDVTAPENWAPKLVALDAVGDHSAYTGAELMQICSSSVSVNASFTNIPNVGSVTSRGTGGYSWDGGKWAAADTLLQSLGETNTPVPQFAVLEYTGAVPAPLLGIRIHARSQTGYTGVSGDFYDVRLPYAETVTPYDDPETDDGGTGNAAGDTGDVDLVFTTIFADLDAAYMDMYGQDFLTYNGLTSYADLLANVTAMIAAPDGDHHLVDGHDSNLMHITQIELLTAGGFWTDRVNTEELA